MKFKSPKQKKGQYYEKLAVEYFKNQGLKLIEKNFHCACGEIDLILKDQAILVFTEVRFRNNFSHGGAAETVNHFKQQKIIKTAKFYLLRYGLSEQVACRFDVLGLTKKENQLHYQWIKNAFQ